MSRVELLENINNIFRDVFADENIVIKEETSANDIEGWDSLTHISILEAVQAECKITFELDEIIEMKNVGDILTAVTNRLQQKETK